VSGATSIDYRGALEAVERILNRGGEPDEVLRAVLEALHTRGVPSAKVRHAQNGRFVDGPSVGGAAERIVSPVVYENTEVGTLELAVDDVSFAQCVAILISPYVARRESGDH
jgi:hypothetical protein